MSDTDQKFWGLTFAEMNLASRTRMRPEDIASYAYPQGERQRYTRAGWKKAKVMGIARPAHSAGPTQVP